MDYVTYFKEELIHLRILIVKLEAAIIGTRAFVGLKDDKKLTNELFAVFDETFLIKVNQKAIITTKLEVEELVLFLIVVEPHGKHESTLSMCLSPLFSFRVVKGEPEETFSQLIHYIDPE